MAVPEALGKYKLLKMIAKGGMGEVFLARQEGVRGFSKLVVVKRILDHLAEDREFTEMFTNEARLAALLTHPNVAQVYDLGEESGSLYIAMEYVHGHSLRALNRALAKQQRTLPQGLAAKICASALRGLHYAHTAAGEDGTPLKLVHRDVSPDNILIGYDGSVKLVDFGVAKATAVSKQTNPGVVKGKIAYMAPEQLQGDSLDARSDLYSMGVVLYELLSGKRPFKAPNDTGLMLAILKETPPPLRELKPDVDPVLAGIASRALRKEPVERYMNAEQMADELEMVGSRLDPGPGVRALLLELFGDEAAAPPVLTPSKGNLPAVTIDIALETRAAAPTSAGSGSSKSSGDEVPTRSVATPLSSSMPRPTPGRGMYVVVGALALISAALFIGLVAMYRSNTTKEAQPVAVETTPDAGPPRVEEPKPAAVVLLDAGALAKTDEPHKNVAPASGTVDLTVLPWGEVKLGKRKLGVTPMDPFVLPAGPQVLTVSNPDLKVERKVRVVVPAGGVARVKINLME
jgi:serine/threonine-protein kinase